LSDAALRFEVGDIPVNPVKGTKSKKGDLKIRALRGGREKEIGK